MRAGVCELESSLGLGHPRMRVQIACRLSYMADPDLVRVIRAYYVGDAVRCPEGQHASVESTARRMARRGRGNKISADLSLRAGAPNSMERKKLVAESQGEPGRRDVCSEAGRLAARAGGRAPGPDSVVPPLPSESPERLEGVSGSVDFLGLL